MLSLLFGTAAGIIGFPIFYPSTEDSKSQACLGCRIQGGRRGRDALSDNPTRSAHGVGEVIPQKDP